MSTTCSDVGNWDRSVIQDILKEIAQTQQIDLNAKKRFKGKSGLHSIVSGYLALADTRRYLFPAPFSTDLL